ncbi:glutamate 5-kinase [Anaerolineales bacterium]
MLELVQQMAGLHQEGYEVIIVSSGAQYAGRARLNFPDLGRSLPAKQMLSAVGQSYLMRIYADLFDIFNIITAQVLLTREDLGYRSRYLNARDTLLTLIDQKIIPIINENDTIATEEIRVGDNDNLSAMVASVLEADLLILLTDQGGLYTADPRSHVDAQLIPFVQEIDEALIAVAGGAGSAGGTGGMLTKLQAAQTAGRSGVVTVIASGETPQVIRQIVEGASIGTHFQPTSSKLESRKRWILTDRPSGKLMVDDGASRKLISNGASLLAVGVIEVEGHFERGALVQIVNPDKHVIAQGLTNYSHQEVEKLIGKNSRLIHDLLGYSYGDAIVHRNNMVLI